MTLQQWAQKFEDEGYRHIARDVIGPDKPLDLGPLITVSTFWLPKPAARRVRKVQDSGLEVWCGMIVGFDHDDARIFEAQRELMRQTDIMHAMVGMLSAIPKTPLYARLKNEGRLDLEDEQGFGTNVIPLGMTRDELRDGYIGLMRDLYDAKFYFERFENLYLARRFNFARTRNAYWRRHPWAIRPPRRQTPRDQRCVAHHPEVLPWA
jgi:hypothetical protein